MTRAVLFSLASATLLLAGCAGSDAGALREAPAAKRISNCVEFNAKQNTASAGSAVMRNAMLDELEDQCRARDAKQQLPDDGKADVYVSCVDDGTGPMTCHAMDDALIPDQELQGIAGTGTVIGSLARAALTHDGEEENRPDMEQGVVVGSRRGDCAVRPPGSTLRDIEVMIVRDDAEAEQVSLDYDDILTAVCARTWYLLATWRSNDHNVIGVWTGAPGHWARLDTAPPPCVAPHDVSVLWGLSRAACPKTHAS